MIEISHNQTENLIQVNRTGEIQIQDVIDYIQRIDQDFNEQNNLYVLDDTRSSLSNYNHKDDYDRLIEEMEKCIRKFSRVHVAIVVDTPANAALSDIYKVMTNRISNYFFRIFSTPEAAKSWLKSCYLDHRF
jgi:hypothetical protein